MDYAPSDAGYSTIPPLWPTPSSHEYANTNEDKAGILFDSFFPLQDVYNVPGPTVTHPLPSAQGSIHFNEVQIQHAIDQLAPFKAPGPNGIPNAVYKHCADLLVPHMTTLFSASFSLGYFPSSWSASTTIVL